MPREYPSALELVGRTPIVRLQKIGRETRCTLLAKLEYLNPGGSVKDRIGVAMIEAAERDGKLKPGGTIVEPTSGNTGVGLAIAAALKGYRCIFVMPDKMSQEKIAMLRGYGAEVVITPTAVDHDSPESYYSVSDRLAEEIPGGFKPDQYSNMSNPEAHYRTTAPEIWEQTGGELNAIVISVGTGGTISGVGRYFKEHKPDVLVVGADPEGSVYTAENDRDVHPYLVEGIGKDTWPKTMNPDVVDEWVRVSDRDSFLTARRLAREEGLLVGGSGGTTVWAALEIAKRFGPDATILTMIPDSRRSPPSTRVRRSTRSSRRSQAGRTRSSSRAPGSPSVCSPARTCSNTSRTSARPRSSGYHRGMATEPLQQLLHDAFPDATELRVEDRTGGGDHFQVVVTSPRFDGLPLLEQHRLVNDAPAGPLGDGTIHELRIKTKGTT